jgi:AcrR family transcriptional regulator
VASPTDSDETRRASRTGGRVRSEDAKLATLRAAAELLEEVGYRGLTIEGVAARSGVAKSTIYRWWASKGALVMDAYSHAVARRMPEPDTGTVAGDLTRFVAQLYRVVDYPLRVQALRGLMAEAQLDPTFREDLRSWADGRRVVVAEMLNRGIQRGELPADLDMDHAVDLVFGPFWYRLLVGHAPLDPALAVKHVELILRGLHSR